MIRLGFTGPAAVLLGGVALVCAVASARAESPYDDLVCSYSWPCSQALRVMACESTNNPAAYNAGQYGLFQVNYPYHASRVGGDPNVLFDPEINVAVAHAIWREQGWRPWACKP